MGESYDRPSTSVSSANNLQLGRVYSSDMPRPSPPSCLASPSPVPAVPRRALRPVATMVLEITSPHEPLPHIPDDVTIPQFFLDSWHPIRPVKTQPTPWFIDDATGREVMFDEVRARSTCLSTRLSDHSRLQVRARVFGIANELKARWNIGVYPRSVCISMQC